MKSVKARVIVSLFVCMFGVAAGAGYCEDTVGSASDMQPSATSAVDAAQPSVTPAPEAVPMPEAATQAMPETAAPVTPAPDAAMTPAPSAEAPVAAPAVVPPVEEKKEEPKPVEKPKKEKKAADMPDLCVKNVAAKKAGGNDVELIVVIKNKGSKTAKAKGGSTISMAVRLEGETSTRVVKIGDEVKAGKKIKYSLGTYPKEKVEGKKVFVMVTYDGKEANKENNTWDKPAKTSMADCSPDECKPAKTSKKGKKKQQ